LAQMPALLTASERERLQRELQGVTQERMLREMVTFLEALTANVPLIVVLEDLHWSDAATLTLLSAVARRRQAARLLIIGTYRPTDVADRQPFLPGIVHELRLHHLCQEIALSLLHEDAVAAYIKERFAGHAIPVGLADAIYQQTDGNPLFMVHLVDHVLSQQATLPQIVSPATLKPALGQLPANLQQMLTYHIERLKAAERHMLEAASVAGMEFSAATVAAALATDALAVEQRCDDLVQRHTVLRRLPATPADLATEGNLYVFRHALLHSLFYNRVGVLRRQQLHQRVGERKEQVSRASGIDMSVELAAHFMASGDAHRSVVYLQQAARTALRRSAHHEARTHLAHALEWLARLPDDETRTKRELELQLMLGVTLMNAQGSSSPEVELTYARAHQLCQQLGSSPQLFPALWGLRTFYLVRSKYHTAREIAVQLLRVAESTQSSDLLVEGHLALGATLVFQGELHDGLQHLEACLQGYDPHLHRQHAYVYGQDPAVIALCHIAPFLVSRGHLDQAVTRIKHAVTMAEEIGHLFSLGYAHCFAGAVYAGRGEAHLTLDHAERAVTLAQVQGFPHLQIMGMLLSGWARAVLGRPEEGVLQLQQALDAQQRIGYEIGRSFYLALLAELHCQLGQMEHGLAVVAEGLERVQTNGEWFYAAELYRLRGQLVLQSSVRRAESEVNGNPESKLQGPESAKTRSPIPDPESQTEAEGDFLQAIAIARQQATKLFELRATMALCRLWQLQGKKTQARERLAEVYQWFTEGLALPDLQNATTLLAELR
ncbi:MAG: AAA family ATPase, partial [Deltaproteobacteria bacterium]|nr:AAA family ATPase [Deltaproteobacteria bacterium]